MRHVAVIVALYTLAVLFLGFAAGRASAQDHHPLHASDYQHWQRPGGLGSCCNDQDCRPTRAFVGEDGLWRAWDGLRWLTIPSTALLPSDLAGDGRSHLCATPSGMVYCFSPAQPKI